MGFLLWTGGESPAPLGSPVARFGLGTASRFRLLTEYRSGVRFSKSANQLADFVVFVEKSQNSFCGEP
ncbi:MAG: hypothetical protein AAB585_02895 [Patescibacteria group bacterium]